MSPKMWLPLLLLFGTGDISLSQETQCRPNQSCLQKDLCPEILDLYAQLKEETDQDKKNALITNLKSKVCNKKEKKSGTGKTKNEDKHFCCEDGTYLPRIEEGGCGKISETGEFVYGGVESRIGEFPFTALIRTDRPAPKYNHRWSCGGNIINTRYVLTAAHCYSESEPINLVRLGEWDVAAEGQPDCFDRSCLPPVQDFVVSLADFTVHPDYTQERQGKRLVNVLNDIGLIRLPRAAEINRGVRLVCLPLSPASLTFEAPENEGTVVGWGFTSAVDQRLESFKTNFRIAVNRQQKAKMKIISKEKCEEEWGSDPNPLPIDFSQGQLCTSNVGVTTCKGDSGGPLFTRNSSTPDSEDNSEQPWTLTGITSFGSSYCGDRSKPAVFTRVSEYLDWIRVQLRK